MPPTWLTVLAWISLGAAFVSVRLIAADIFLRGYRAARLDYGRRVAADSALFRAAGVAGLSALGALEQPPLPAGDRRHYPFAVSVGISDTHCGAGCALGDLIAEWVLFAIVVTIAGVALWPTRPRVARGARLGELDPRLLG